MTYEWIEHIAELETCVAVWKAAYIRERDAHRPATDLWNEYARLLHALRLRKRELKDG